MTTPESARSRARPNSLRAFLYYSICLRDMKRVLAGVFQGLFAFPAILSGWPCNIMSAPCMRK